ncbi:MAG: hypothetical protein Terrestrivirus1_218 [Terrestrivirus sp.]|uniref:Right handed beta helix domain-containing protein n=1 Tax=Terrestrivirus sp. TaxID=2487775 RepID=A0A3G4ZLP8_9VIRU|nr:MAG: hypothetical protein Terrestrivirus1_218 [Terrestrivirus sp.]
MKVKTITVSNLSDSGEGSLRCAINESKKYKYSNIVFSVTGLILLQSALPVIASKVTINATRLPSNSLSPLVEIDCNGNNGIVFAKKSSGSEILGLAITNSSGNGITIVSNCIFIHQNYIGIDLNGNKKGNKENGILISSKSKGNKIGSNPDNISGYASNVISGNGQNGIQIDCSSQNVIASNFIGTDPSGLNAIPNTFNGILIKGSKNNTVGGTVYTNSNNVTNNPTGSKGTVPIVYIFPPLGNLISGNTMNGVMIDSSSKNVFNGNFIGTDVSGIKALANSSDGIYILNSKAIVLRGCTITDNPFVYYNVCSGNTNNGIHVSNSKNTIIQGNFTGTGANNASVVANGKNGILIDGTSKKTTVGGPIPLGNVSAGNNLNGIYVTDTASSFITYNTFGGLYAFGAAAPNGNHGLLIDSSGKKLVARTNVFSGNLQNGIKLAGNASKVLVESNIVGLDTKGTAILPNNLDGLVISDNANHNTIGHQVVSVIPRNAFSGNLENGIHITDNASYNQVKLSFIGLDVSGLDSYPNQLNGVLLDKSSNNNLIGIIDYRQKLRSNYISANLQYGITINDLSHDNAIINNNIGITVTNVAAPNVLGAVNNTTPPTNNNVIFNN